MPTLNNTQAQSMGIVNHATGAIRTSAAAAAALTITVGFVPRKIVFRNVTDRISDKWYDGIDELAIFQSIVGIAAKLDADAGVTDTNYGATWNVTGASYHTVAAGTNTLELANGIVNNQDGSFTLSATTMVASKGFVWDAVG